MRFKQLALVGVISFLITACGTNSHYNAFKKNYDIVFNPPAVVDLTWSEIGQRPSDLLRVQFANAAPAYLALAFSENDLQKYRSADNVVMVFQHGRLVRTSGLKNDLQYTRLGFEPLSNLNNTRQVQMTQDWFLKAGYPFSLQLKRLGEESFQALDKTITATKYSESVLLNGQYVGENLYWFSAEGTLLKSSQLLQSEQKQIEILWLSQIYRHTVL